MPVDKKKLAAILEKLSGENVSYGEIARDAIEELRRASKEDDEYTKHEGATRKHQLHMQSLSRRLSGAALLHHDEILSGAHLYDSPSGVYFLIKGSKIVYVGQSENVLSRLSDHHSRIKFTRYAFIPVEKQHLDLVESLYIHFLRPRNNGIVATPVGRDLAAPLTFQKILDMALAAENHVCNQDSSE